MVFVLAPITATAQDVDDFDVGGIKLGMSMDDAITAIKSKCQQEGARATVAPVATPNPLSAGICADEYVSQATQSNQF